MALVGLRAFIIAAVLQARGFGIPAFAHIVLLLRSPSYVLKSTKVPRALPLLRATSIRLVPFFTVRVHACASGPSSAVARAAPGIHAYKCNVVGVKITGNF